MVGNNHEHTWNIPLVVSCSTKNLPRSTSRLTRSKSCILYLGQLDTNNCWLYWFLSCYKSQPKSFQGHCNTENELKLLRVFNANSIKMVRHYCLTHKDMIRWWALYCDILTDSGPGFTSLCGIWWLFSDTLVFYLLCGVPVHGDAWRFIRPFRMRIIVLSCH